jgi:uncharacterized membrane protein
VGELDPRLSKAVTGHSLVVAGLSVVHSLRARGLHRTLLFAALGNAIPVLGELLAVNLLKVLRHHVRPQVAGVPLAIVLGWHNITYGIFAVTESILDATGLREDKRNQALAPAAALAATNLDLLLDPCGLGLGLWEWSHDGSYATEVEGPNGKRGIPLLNYTGWISLTTGPARPGAAGGLEAGWSAALLLLCYYLPVAAWATKRRRRRYLLYSAPFAVALWAGLKGRSPTS